jgi:hypothetical protein
MVVNAEGLDEVVFKVERLEEPEPTTLTSCPTSPLLYPLPSY